MSTRVNLYLSGNLEKSVIAEAEERGVTSAKVVKDRLTRSNTKVTRKVTPKVTPTKNEGTNERLDHLEELIKSISSSKAQIKTSKTPSNIRDQKWAEMQETRKATPKQVNYIQSLSNKSGKPLPGGFPDIDMEVASNWLDEVQKGDVEGFSKGHGWADVKPVEVKEVEPRDFKVEASEAEIKKRKRKKAKAVVDYEKRMGVSGVGKKKKKSKYIKEKAF